MNCDQSNDFMMKYLDGELNDKEHAELIHHINKCSICCTEFQAYSSIAKSLEEDKGVEPPEDFEIKVMSKINLMEDHIKIRKEKRLVFICFLSSVILTCGMIACAVFLRDYVLEIMQYFGIPEVITYTIYAGLSKINYAVEMLVRIAYYFNSVFTDIYYILIGLLVIAAMSKIYSSNEIQNRRTDILQNE